MVICGGEKKHIPGMLALLKQVGGVHRGIRPDIFRAGAQKYDAGELEAILADPSLPIFVAAEGDFVAGYCFCQLKEYRDSSVMTDRRELYIDDLCVDENRRGQKIASRLYEFVLDYAREQSCRFVTLNVWSGNDGAMAFYERMGLRPRSITMERDLEEN